MNEFRHIETFGKKVIFDFSVKKMTLKPEKMVTGYTRAETKYIYNFTNYLCYLK